MFGKIRDPGNPASWDLEIRTPNAYPHQGVALRKFTLAQYPQLAALLRAVDPRSSEVAFKTKVVPYLIDLWIDDYTGTVLPLKPEIVETTVSGFDYLFDLSLQRLVAALGISHGRHGEPRDAA